MAVKKLKTKKALLKRVKISKTGKVLRKKAGKSHLLSSKTANRKRRLRKTVQLPDAYKKMVKRALPYGA